MDPWQSFLSSLGLSAFLPQRKKSDFKEDFSETGAITICRGDRAVREREIALAEEAQGAMLGIL